MKASSWSPSPWDPGTLTATSFLTEKSSITPEGRHGNGKCRFIILSSRIWIWDSGSPAALLHLASKGLHLFMICQCLAFDCTFQTRYQREKDIEKDWIMGKNANNFVSPPSTKKLIWGGFMVGLRRDEGCHEGFSFSRPKLHEAGGGAAQPGGSRTHEVLAFSPPGLSQSPS